MISIMSAKLADRLLALPGAARRLAQGQSLFRRGDTVRRMFVVREGGVELVRHDAAGRAIVLQRAEPGAVLAEASLYAPRYHCDAAAFAPTRLHAVGKPDLIERLRRDREFAELFAAHLAHEVQQARLRAEILALKTVAERLDAWLAWHGAMPAKGAWRALAQQIGVSPEALYRELARRNG